MVRLWLDVEYARNERLWKASKFQISNKWYSTQDDWSSKSSSVYVRRCDAQHSAVRCFKMVPLKRYLAKNGFTHTYIYKMKIEMRLHVVAVKYCHCEMTTKQRKRTPNGEYVIRKRKSLLAERLFIMSMQICVECAVLVYVWGCMQAHSRAISSISISWAHAKNLFDKILLCSWF